LTLKEYSILKSKPMFYETMAAGHILTHFYIFVYLRPYILPHSLYQCTLRNGKKESPEEDLERSKRLEEKEKLKPPERKKIMKDMCMILCI